ncbi:MAG TPA: sulfotransferase [Bryobacteraceae bacterium]|nr:sulfotransferase [Bryobacteraceae bacterium]
MPRLPNFFLVGAPKAGTTALYCYLGQHPRIYTSPMKEPNFFAAEVREENFDSAVRRSLAREEARLSAFLSGPMQKKRFGGIVADWEDYLRLFAQARDELAVGEASVCYLWSQTAPVRIAEKIPGAKILIMLRNPVDRAFSQYLHGVGNGSIRWSFREHIRRNLRQRSGVFSLAYPFLEFGLYAEQVTRYRELFAENVWVSLYDDFVERPADILREICRFLGVDAAFPFKTGAREMEAQVPRIAAAGWLKRSGWWQAGASVTPAKLRPLIRKLLMHRPTRLRMEPADREYLANFYRDDLRKLATLLDRDLSRWCQGTDGVSKRIAGTLDGWRCPETF